jgi:hypothetical protein
MHQHLQHAVSLQWTRLRFALHAQLQGPRQHLKPKARNLLLPRASPRLLPKARNLLLPKASPRLLPKARNLLLPKASPLLLLKANPPPQLQKASQNVSCNNHPCLRRWLAQQLQQAVAAFRQST